jgi:predicted DNA binding CopG/RHH family protein
MEKLTDKEKKSLRLDKEELEIFEAFEKRELKPVKKEKNWKKKLTAAAEATIAKNKHISIRLSEKDLLKLRVRATELGIPYQTLIGALLHQYVEGKISGVL